MHASIHHFRCRSGQHVVMRADVRFRVAVAGAELKMLVLAPRPSGCVGVDLDSGAFVRAAFRRTGRRTPRSPRPGGRSRSVAPSTRPTRPSRRRCSSTAPPGEWAGPAPGGSAAGSRPSTTRPRARCWASPAPASPYWTLVGDRPSLALVVPSAAAEVRLGPNGYECIFGWQGATHQYPLVDPFLLDTLHRLERRHMGAHDMARVLGFRPGRILVRPQRAPRRLLLERGRRPPPGVLNPRRSAVSLSPPAPR